MSHVTFELITRTSEVPEKNVPVLHVRVPSRNAEDFVVRKATDADLETYAEEYAAFCARETPGQE